jgi:hypothetical protein
MAKGGGGSTQTTVSNVQPWSAQIPYLKEIFGEAQKLYRSNTPQYYPGATVAPTAPEAEQALAMQAARAAQGSPLNVLAAQQLQASLGGQYLAQGNPWFAQMAQRVAEAVTPQVNSQFAAAGRYGSGAHSGALGQALGREIGALAWQDYAQERENQLRAATLAPQLAAQDYADIERLAAVGAEREAMAQALINADIARFNFNESLPFNKLAQYQDLIAGDYGSTRTETVPVFRGPSLLSGATAGAELGLGLGGGAWGGLIGAGLGGLLSWF